jgi:hypothetical protein
MRTLRDLRSREGIRHFFLINFETENSLQTCHTLKWKSDARTHLQDFRDLTFVLNKSPVSRGKSDISPSYIVSWPSVCSTDMTTAPPVSPFLTIFLSSSKKKSTSVRFIFGSVRSYRIRDRYRFGWHYRISYRSDSRGSALQNNKQLKTTSKVFLLFKPEIKTPKRGNTEFRIQMANNPDPHVDSCISVVVIPTYCSRHTTPPCVMTTGVWNGTTDPDFGHSGVQESLLTQVPQKPRLITILPQVRIVVNGEMGWGVWVLLIPFKRRGCCTEILPRITDRSRVQQPLRTHTRYSVCPTYFCVYTPIY